MINIFTTDVVEFIDSNSLVGNINYFDEDFNYSSIQKGAEKRVIEELHPKNVDIKVFLLEEDRDEETEFTQFLVNLIFHSIYYSYYLLERN